MRRTNCWGAILVAAVAAAAIALKFFPVPFAWIGFGGFVAGVVGAVFAPAVSRLPLVLSACVSLSLGLGELIVRPPKVLSQQEPPISIEHPLLGWSLKPSLVSREVGTVDGQVYFEQTYSIDSDGRRVPPPDRGDSVEGCLFFFSDSIVFGAGVSDAETFPYQVGLQTGGRFRVVNFGVGGYGAEQMLAQIELGPLGSNPPCEPTHIFYLALPDHILRAAGKRSFSKRGPRYRLGHDGIPGYLGTGLADNPSRRGWRDLLVSQIDKSRIFRRLTDRPPETIENDLALYFAIVKRAFDLFEEHWPAAERHVISWDLEPSLANGQAQFHAGLRTVPAEIHLIDEIVPGYTEDPMKYSLHPLDLHPNAKTYEMLASYLTERVLHRVPSNTHQPL